MAKKRFEVGARERLPRTNEEAAEYWADGILQNEEMPSISVNSVLLRGDTIYSFGSHFPMAKMVRDSRGRVRRVVTNSDHYPSRGFANTGWDQSNVKRAVEDRVARSKRKIQHDHLPLSDYGNYPALRLRPELNDIEPEPYPQTEVPLYFEAWNPGPEPVDDGEGCVAGTTEEHTWVEEKFVREDEQRPGDVYVRDAQMSYGDTKYIYVERTTHGRFEWIKDWDHRHARLREEDGQRIELKQCPHCEEFARRHREWSIQMNGGYRWSPGTRGRHFLGFARHQELRKQHGGEQGWREARKADLRRVRRLRKLRKEWEERNYCALSEAPTDRHGIVKLDADGFVPRRPVERQREKLAVKRRKAERQRKREQREYEAHLREQARRRKIAIKEWAEHGIIVANDDVILWCVRHGIKPNPDDGTITLVKAVQPDTYRSGYNGGMEYRPGTTVTAPDFDGSHGCGRGLHFGPNKMVAATNLGYYVRTEPVFLACRVAPGEIIPVGDKCKAPSCYVEGELQ